jgi:hypothetical protein
MDPDPLILEGEYEIFFFFFDMSTREGEFELVTSAS